MGSFREPREGIHSIRVLDIAIVDLFLTILAAYVISKKHFIAVFIVLMILSVIIHTILGIKTKTNGWLINSLK